MFNSVIIDVAIGLTLSFLAVSLAVSALTEAISSALKWREKTLLEGVKSLVNDLNFNGVARQLYNHALVNPLASGAAKSVEELTHKPAYINAEQFALAFYDTFGKGASKDASPAELIDDISDPQLKSAMQALWAASSQDVEQFKHKIAIWFDNSMDRVSGWYKRRTQLVSFCLAVAIAGLFNVNVLYESAEIWARPSLIADLATTHFNEDREASAATASKIFNALEPQYLVGWVNGPKPHDSESWVIALSSWIIVAASTLFGAPFWFDSLQRLINLRGTGDEPSRSPPSSPAKA